MKPVPLFSKLQEVRHLSPEGLRLYEDLRAAYGSWSAARAAVHEHGSYRAALEAAPKSPKL